MDTDKDKQPEQLSDLTEPPPLDDTQVEEPYPKPVQKSPKKLFLTGAVIAGLIAVAVVGFFLTQRKEASPAGETPPPTASSTLGPTATPEPTFNRSEWSLEVLNGSSVTGTAKKLADKLAELGYKIVKVGNADRSDYKVSELYVVKDMKDKQDLLLEDLKKEISLASVSGELKDSTASARIIIGKE